MTDYPLVATRVHPSGINQPNLGPSERTLSVGVGAILLIHGLRSRGIGGIIEAFMGAYGLVRGVTGKCLLKKAVTSTPFEEAFQGQRGWKRSEAVTRSITIGKPQEQVLSFIKEPQNIARLISWVDSVEDIDGNTSRWTASAPLGQKLEWSLTLSQVQDGSLRWNTAQGTTFEHEILVHFSQAPANRGTEVKVVIVGKPPLGALGYAVASGLAAFTDKALLNVLRSIKQQLETGEVSTNHMRHEQSPDCFYVRPDAADETENARTQGRGYISPGMTGVALEGGNV